MTSQETFAIILALLTSLAAGLVGSFALMRRMSLAGNVISHIALPGLGLLTRLSAPPQPCLLARY